MALIRFGTALVAMAGLAGVGLLGYGLSYEHPANAILPANAGSVGEITNLGAVGPARIEPVSGEIELSTSIVGVLSTVSVKEGERVQKGQVLAVLDNSDAIARVAQAQASLQMQRVKLERLLNGARPEEMRQAKAAVEEQDAALSSQNRELVRQRTLQARGFASMSTLEQAQSAQAASIARKRAKSEALAQMVAGPRQEDVSSAMAEVQLAQAQLKEASSALDKTIIRAPVDSTVLRIYKHVGESVGLLGSASTIMQVGDLDQIVARAQIDEADISRIARGSQAYVTSAAYPGKRFYGHVTEISPRLGAKTIQTGAPTEKRDASVLDVLVTLGAGTSLPIGLRVDCYVLAGSAAP